MKKERRLRMPLFLLLRFTESCWRQPDFCGPVPLRKRMGGKASDIVDTDYTDGNPSRDAGNRSWRGHTDTGTVLDSISVASAKHIDCLDKAVDILGNAGNEVRKELQQEQYHGDQTHGEMMRAGSVIQKEIP
jgi:hypothetical protein